jgi:hypothetical protein
MRRSFGLVLAESSPCRLERRSSRPHSAVQIPRTSNPHGAELLVFIAIKNALDHKIQNERAGSGCFSAPIPAQRISQRFFDFESKLSKQS